MRPSLRPRTALAIALLCLLPTAAPAGDAGAPVATATRTVKAILRDYARAIGGPGALGKKRNVYVKRDITVKGMGVNGTEERWATSGGQVLSVTTLPGIGVIKQGSTGRVRWSEDPINGLRILKGAEEEQARIDGTWNADVKLDKLYRTIRPAARPDGAPKDDPLDCVELGPAKGLPAVACFDARTHLRVYQQGKQSTPQGEVPYAARLTDWREVEGVKLPFREETTAGPMTVEAKLAEVKFDQKLAPSLFQMPKPR
jgi:zinc protease